MDENNKNKSCSLNAYGVDSWDKIASDRTSLDLKCLQEVSKRFGISPTEINKVSGEVGLLIGMKNLALHPKQFKENIKDLRQIVKKNDQINSSYYWWRNI